MHDLESMIHEHSMGQDPDKETADGGSARVIAQVKASDPKVKQQIAADLRKMDRTIDEWFAGIDTSATFLGIRIRGSKGSAPGVHKLLVEKLRKVEGQLANELGCSVKECARQLNVYSVSGLRLPTKAIGGTAVSMHSLGLAIDINYKGNPFLRGSRTYQLIERATRLAIGSAIDALGPPLHGAGRNWDRLHRASEAFKAYLRLGEPANLQRLREQIARAGDGRDLAAWQAQIAADRCCKPSFGDRDPAKGFLDLDRRLVVALVEIGGLRWGGMFRTGKDIMHFDWRGQKKDRNAPESWRQVGAPTSSELGVVEEAPGAIRKPAREESPRGLTTYAPIALGKDCTWRKHEDGRRTCEGWFTLPARSGIYVPERFEEGRDIDVIVYLHGHLIRACGTTPTDQIDQYWTRPRFRLREGLDQSGRSFVLVAPSLGPRSQSGLLHRAGGFDTYMKQVLAALVRWAEASGRTRPRDVGRIILACHSGGGSTMRAIATSSGTYAGRIRECWGFDCLYGKGDPDAWAQWAQSSRDRRLYIHYTVGGGTRASSVRLRGKGLPNVVVPQAADQDAHCDVPRIYWQRRIQAALR